MKISEIISQVDDVWVSNSLSSAVKVSFLNAIQRELYRKVDFPNVVYEFQTTTDVAMYTLPGDCPADRIRMLVVSDGDENIEYPFKGWDEPTTDDERYHTTLDSYLILHPTPTDELDVFLHYAPSPSEFSASNLNVSPSTPTDYHQYYVWKLAEYCAKAKKDVALANNFVSDSIVVLNDMIKKFKPTQASGFQIEMKW